MPLVGFIIKLIFNTIVVFLAAYVVPGVRLYTKYNAIIIAMVIGMINALIRDIFIFMHIPPYLLLIGVASTIEITVIALLADRYLPGFEVDSFWWALTFGIVAAVMNVFIHAVVYW